MATGAMLCVMVALALSLDSGFGIRVEALNRLLVAHPTQKPTLGGPKTAESSFLVPNAPNTTSSLETLEKVMDEQAPPSFSMEGVHETSRRLVPDGPKPQQSPDSPSAMTVNSQTMNSSQDVKMEGGFSTSLYLVPTGPNPEQSPDGPATFMCQQSLTRRNGI